MTLKELDAKMLSPLVIPVVLIVLLSLLSGCVNTIIMRNPKTGEITQCNPFGNSQRVAENCATGYEKLGWQRIQ